MGNNGALQGIIFSLLSYPALWPALLLPWFLAGGWIVTRRVPAAGLDPATARRVALVAGALPLVFYAWAVGNYLASVQFVDFYEPREASLAWLLTRGGEVYTGFASDERYTTPYGPVLYLVLGACQWLLGASVFSTKLPGALAGLGSVVLFWIVQRRLGVRRREAWIFTGVEAALLLALRYTSFWAKTDPLILLCVTLGILCALGREIPRVLALGVCAGLAVDLKPHALAYFLPVAVIAAQAGWRGRAFGLTAGVAVVTALGPFVADARQFPLGNYLDFLRTTAHEGSGWSETLGFGRWVALLVTLVVVSDRALARASATAGWRWAYRASLAVAVALVAYPACAVGAGQGHLLALFPLVLLAPGDRFAGNAGVVEALPPPGLFWQAATAAGLAAGLLVSVQTGWRVYTLRHDMPAEAQACRAELWRFAAQHPDWTILSASGDGANDLATNFRHELVFAGHPIGIDAAAAMDYDRAGAPEPSLTGLERALGIRRGRPVVWIVPRGDVPFADASIYDPRRPAHSSAFRQEFLARHERQAGVGKFFDLYYPREGALASAQPAFTP